MKNAKDAKKPRTPHHTDEKLSAVIEEYLEGFKQRGMLILSDMSKEEQAVFVNWAQNIVDRYGYILEENPSKIKNVMDLPYPKENIKIAIKVLLPAYLAKRSDDIVELLKDRYARLGTFQEVSQEDKEAILKKSDANDQESELTDAAFFSTYQKYMQIIVSEQKILFDDINAFIDDLQNI